MIETTHKGWELCWVARRDDGWEAQFLYRREGDEAAHEYVQGRGSTITLALVNAKNQINARENARGDKPDTMQADQFDKFAKAAYDAAERASGSRHIHLSNVMDHVRQGNAWAEAAQHLRRMAK